MTLRFTKLTRERLRALEVHERVITKGQRKGETTTVGDRIVEHGIEAERTADGDLRWCVAIMVDGRRIHRAIGCESEGVTRTQCEEFIEQARTDARRGRLNLPEGRKLTRLFDEAIDDYLRRLATTENGKNVPVKKRQARMYLRPFFGAMPLDAISVESVERYKKQRSAARAAPATINRELATLSHILNKAVEWKWIDRLPCRPRKDREGPGRIEALTDAQCDALMRAAIEGPDKDLWLFVAFGLNTAMRHSEIMEARWEHLDLEARRLYLPRAKAGAREQPITAELADTLANERETRKDRKGWIFPSPHQDAKTGHRVRMDGPFRDAVIAAGLDPKRITPHVMRHTAITNLVQSGADLATVQRISGHKTTAMVMRYTHVHAPQIDRAIAAIGRAVPDLTNVISFRQRAATQKIHKEARRKRNEKPRGSAGTTGL